MKLLLLIFIFFLMACSTYQFGNGKRAVPGGYDRVSIPMFVNKTHEVGVETYFTESLRLEFERSHLAKVTSKADAQVILEGLITSVKFSPTLTITNLGVDQPATSKELLGPDVRYPTDNTKRVNTLPTDTALSKEYIIEVSIKLLARKVSDNTVLWQGDFSGRKNFFGALIGTPGLSSSDAIYNQSARQQNVSKLALEMMSEAHDRLTENF